MIINTQSGPMSINKRTSYGKWILGWVAGGGWSGIATLNSVYNRACRIKLKGCSWYALGVLMATEQGYGRAHAEGRMI